MNPTELETLLSKLASEQGALVAARVKAYLDAKLEAELGRIDLQFDHVDLVLKLILAEVGGSAPDYTVITYPDGSKTVSVKAPKKPS